MQSHQGSFATSIATLLADWLPIVEKVYRPKSSSTTRNRPPTCSDREVDLCRASPEQQWSVTPETAHLGEDAKEENSTSDAYWMPGVNHFGNYGLWSFTEVTDMWEMQDKFEAQLEARLSLICEKAVGATQTVPR